MRRKEDFPIEKVTLNLFQGDFEKLRNYHPRIGAAKIIRELVRAHLQRVEDEMNERQDLDSISQLPLPL